MNKGHSFAQLLLRLALGAGFILPVMDRLGLLGAPGSKGVTWGSWDNFVAYTNVLLPFLNKALSNVTSIIVTIAEMVFGICLVIGFKTKYIALGSALLTAGFGICMAIFVNIYAPFGYPVFVFTGGAWLLSSVDDFKYSIDNMFAKRKQSSTITV